MPPSRGYGIEVYFVAYEDIALIARAKKESVITIANKADLEFLDVSQGRPVSYAKKDANGSRMPHAASHKGIFGMVYFTQHSVYDLLGEGDCHFTKETDDKHFPDIFVKPCGRGKCYFIPYDSIISCDKWPIIEENLIVEERHVLIYAAGGPSTLVNSEDPIVVVASSSPSKKNLKANKAASAVVHAKAEKKTTKSVTMVAAISKGVVTKVAAAVAKKEKEPVIMDLIDHVRVGGPSNRRMALLSLQSGSSRGSRKSAAEQEEEAERGRQFSDAWKGMKDSMFWRIEWGPDTLVDNEYYMAPMSGKLELEDRIENLEYFYSKESITAHIEANPCLKYTWKDLWPLLQKAGWTRVHAGKNGSQVEFHSPVPSDTELKPGVHVFRSKFAVMTFINRFPYPLQESSIFSKTLEAQGWQKRSQGRYAASNPSLRFDDPKDKGLVLDLIRGKLWQDPAYLFVLNSKIKRARLEAAVHLTKEFAMEKDKEADTPLKSGSGKVLIDTKRRKEKEKEKAAVARDLVKAQIPAKSTSSSSSSSSLSSGLSLATYLSGNDVYNSATAEKFANLLNDSGWKLMPCNFTGEWWQYEIITMAPWKLSGPRENLKPLIGFDCFWGLPDIFLFLKKHGTAQPLKPKPIELELDYRKPEWTLNIRIKELAEKKTFKGNNLYKMLLHSGWKSFPAPKHIETNTENRHIFVPWWNATDITARNLQYFALDFDYYCHTEEMLNYLVDNGNYKVQQEMSRRNSPTAPALKNAVFTPAPFVVKSPVPEDGTGEDIDNWIAKIRLDKKNGENTVFNGVWGCLKEVNWENLNTKKSSFGVPAVYVPPWSHHYKFGSANAASVNVSKLEQNRDYFEDQDAVMNYLAKYGNVATTNPATPIAKSGRGVSRRLSDPKGGDGGWNSNVKRGKSTRPEADSKKSKRQKTNTLSSEITQEELLLLGCTGHDESSDDDSSDDDAEDMSEASEEEVDKEDLEQYNEEIAEELVMLKHIPDIVDRFRSDYKALLDAARSEENSLDIRSAKEVQKELNARRRLSYCNVGELGTIYHNIDALMKTNKLKPGQLDDYEKNVDYWDDLSDMLTFVHGQFRAHGHSVVNVSREAQKKPIRDFIPKRKNQPVDDGINLPYRPIEVGMPKDVPYHAVEEHLGPPGSPQNTYRATQAKSPIEKVLASVSWLWGGIQKTSAMP